MMTEKSYQPSICVITPTIGRPTLRQTLESGAKDLGSKDLWIVSCDGWQEDARKIYNQVNQMNCTYHTMFLESFPPSGDYGNNQRDQAMSIATQDYFIFLDDDDIFVPNAIKIIKREIAEHYPRPIMFRMINGNKELLWRTREMTPGNVGGSMFCCPNTPGRLGTWANGGSHRSDFNFIEQTLKLYGPSWRQNLFWSGDVIVHCRPEMEDSAMGPHDLAERAAEWWKVQLSAELISGPVGDVTSDLRWLAKCQADPPTEGQLDTFKRILANQIVDKIKKCATDQFLVKIKVDYAPCHVLSQVAEHAGIDKIYFPIKTIMCISSRGIEVTCGYGKPWEKIE